MLIVEDSRIVAGRLGDLLSEIDGVTVVGKPDTADQAIAYLEASEPDAIILDLHLRQGTGFEVLERIRELDRQPLVIILTNYPLPQYRELSLSRGADFFFDKSTQFDEVVKVVERLEAND